MPTSIKSEIRAIVASGQVVKQEASARAARIKAANNLLNVISKYGSRIFWSDEHQIASKFVIEEQKYARVYFVDAQTENKMALMGAGAWANFSHHPEAQLLIKRLGKFISSGLPIDEFHISAGALVDYDADSLQTVRRTAVRAKIIKSKDSAVAALVPVHHRPGVVERAGAAVKIIGKSEMTERELREALDVSNFTSRNVIKYLREVKKLYVSNHIKGVNHWEKAYRVGAHEDVER